MAHVIGYATMMDPANARKLGLTGKPELVVVNSMQRWFGFPDPAGRRLEDVFDRGGSLQIRDIGSTTVSGSPEGHTFNAVLFPDVPDAVMRQLDEIEARSYLDRLRVPPQWITRFSDRSAGCEMKGNIFTYAAPYFLEGGRISFVRQDVIPNARYLADCRAAARTHGEPFLAMYDQTTFLADRATLASQYY